MINMDDAERNGVPAEVLARAVWRKSSFSGALGNCVEVAALETGQTAVRHSRHPARPALVFTPGQWSAFLAAVGTGQFRPGALPAR